MPASRLFLSSIAAFGLGQMLLPTAHAQPPNAARTWSYRVSVRSLHTERTAFGTQIRGQIKNTGRQTLTYTSVIVVFTDLAGQEVGRSDGYLTAGPLTPGQSVEFCASSPLIPAFSGVTLLLREAGHPVEVKALFPFLTEAQAASPRRRITVW